MSVEGGIENVFGDYRSPDKGRDWAEARSVLVVGELVRGRVIERRQFGVFVDIGVGFPALLEVVRFKDARQRRYDLGDYPAVGDTITARVVAFNEANRQVGLSQLDPDPYLDSSK
jgi:ribosomal protein S1